MVSTRLHATVPNFRFRVADVRNELYNPAAGIARGTTGFRSSRVIRLRLPDLHLYTHARPGHGDYLSEIARILRPGGRTLITYFLLNPDSEGLIREGRSAHTFRSEEDGCRSDNPDRPENAVAYTESRIADLYKWYGFNPRASSIRQLVWTHEWRELAGYRHRLQGMTAGTNSLLAGSAHSLSVNNNRTIASAVLFTRGTITDPSTGQRRSKSLRPCSGIVQIAGAFRDGSGSGRGLARGARLWR